MRPKPPVANITAAARKSVQLAVARCDSATTPRGPAVLDDEQVDDMVLVEELDLVLDALLVQRLQDHVPGAVGGEARAPTGPSP